MYTCIKYSGHCLTTFLNTSKFEKNTLLPIVFSTLFLVFGNVVEQGLLRLIYYINALLNRLGTSIKHEKKMAYFEKEIHTPQIGIKLKTF